jgi:osmotically-inducible protein OsmY
MPRIRSILIGGVVGAAAAYFFDPELGTARRARLQDQVEARARDGRREVERAVRQLQGRLMGAVAQLEVAPRPDDDLALLSRVESVLLGIPGYPRAAVEAEVVDGRLVLRGRVASEEQAREIVEAASGVRGVLAVESLLGTPAAEAPNRTAPRRASRT